VLDEGSLSNDLFAVFAVLIDLRSFAHLKTDKAILRRFVPCPRTDCLRTCHAIMAQIIATADD
jgi:hypothetical protein